MSGGSARRRRVLSDYGMVGVLALLCVFFSLATLTEQTPAGATAAPGVAAEAAKALSAGGRVMLAGRAFPDDAAFAEKLREELKARGLEVAGVALGEPRDARELLQKLALEPARLEGIICSRAAREWLVFSDLNRDFPSLGTPRLFSPRPYRWPNFLKSENLLNIANQIAVIAIVAIGMTTVVITGGIDLSVGSLLALSAVLSARLIRDYGGAEQASVWGMGLSCLAAVLCCGGVGGFSGVMITRCGIPPFIVTLAMMLVGSGMAYILAKGQSVYQIPDSFVWLGRGADLFGLPNAVVLMAGLYAAAHVLMTRFRLGRYIYAVGGNRQAAIFSGVPVERVLLVAYVASGALAGLGGVVMASQLKSGSPTYGAMYELYVIAAVVVGGASLNGGEGKMLGTLTGAFTIAVIQNGMNLLGVESYTQKVVLGLVILFAVLADRVRQHALRRL